MNSVATEFNPTKKKILSKLKFYTFLVFYHEMFVLYCKNNHHLLISDMNFKEKTVTHIDKSVNKYGLRYSVCHKT